MLCIFTFIASYILHLTSVPFLNSLYCICSRCRPSLVRKQLGELGKVSEEGERTSKEETAARYGHTHVLCTQAKKKQPARITLFFSHNKTSTDYSVCVCTVKAQTGRTRW